MVRKDLHPPNPARRPYPTTPFGPRRPQQPHNGGFYVALPQQQDPGPLPAGSYLPRSPTPGFIDLLPPEAQLSQVPQPAEQLVGIHGHRQDGNGPVCLEGSPRCPDQPKYQGWVEGDWFVASQYSEAPDEPSFAREFEPGPERRTTQSAAAIPPYTSHPRIQGSR